MYHRIYDRIHPKQIAKAQKPSASKAKVKAAAETSDPPASSSQVVTANTTKKPVNANLRRARFSNPSGASSEPATTVVPDGIAT